MESLKKRAVMYGAGNIGRGFIGMLLAQSGYRVTMIDVAKPVVDALNERASYPVRILDDHALDDAFAGAHAVVHLGALGSVPRSVADPMTSHRALAALTRRASLP